VATLKVHEDDCIQLLGEPFTEVHKFLDELFKYVGPTHRSFRHNRRGVENVRKRWGDKAAQAAKIHIERDGEYI
jgi:hypothetical protein